MFERWMKYLDWVAIPTGLAALICNILLSNEGIEKDISYALCALAAILGGIYIAYAVILLCRKPLFDWHLINGHFLRKVCCLVLLIPSILAFVAVHCIGSSKELTYAEELYECGEKELPCRIKREQESPNIYWSVYYHFIDPGNQHMTTTKRGRAWAACIGILGMFLLNGLLVSSIIGYVDRRKEKWQKGEVKYRFLKWYSHYVVIGGNDMVAGIVKQLLTKIYEDKCFWTRFSRPYILVQTSRDVEEFRRELFSILNDEEQKRIIIYYGNRASIVDIRELKLNKAEEVYILGEEARTDDIESYHDTMNMECMKLLNQEIKGVKRFQKVKDKDNRLVCRVMFEYQTSFNILQTTDVDDNKIKFLPFNYYEMWAQNVLVCQELAEEGNCRYLPLEGFNGIKSTEDCYVHLVIVGMSRMGVAMAIEAAHLAHYPNYETKKIRTKITFIDKNAAEEKDFFIGRFKELFELSHWKYGNAEEYLVWQKTHTPIGYDYLGGDFVDLEWEFINGSVEHYTIQQYLKCAALNRNVKLTIAICLPENSRAIAAAAYLPDDIYNSNNTLQILVYQRLNDDLLKQINNNKRYRGKLKAFGMAKECYNSSLVELSESIAKEIDAAYNQYMWEKMQKRYTGEGFIEDDYDDLTGWSYSNSEPEKQNEMKALCDQWMEEHYQKSFFEVRIDKENLKEIYQPKDIGKPKAAKMWSNQYNIYSMWTKCRGVLTNDKFILNSMQNIDFDNSMLEELGKMEHNRWVVEQLLLRYRPLTKDEQKEAKVDGLYSSSSKKNYYKGKYAHLNICSNSKLNKIDYNISELDRYLISVLPKAYREYLNKRK